MKTLTLHDYSEFRISYGTHPGMTGKNNEDFVDIVAFDANYPDEEVVLYLGIVADGVGGQSAGERASRLATETIIDYFSHLDKISIDNILIHINKAVTKANNIVVEESNDIAEYSGMATTIAMVAILEGLLFTSHVGDSRIYMMRDDVLYQLTSDHSWVQEALEAGIISQDEAKTHPNRNVIRRSLGTLDTVIVDQVMMSSIGTHFWQGMPLRDGDHLLLCSDGLTDMISASAIRESVLRYKSDEDLESTVAELITKANEAGGKDNITVMLLSTGQDFTHNKVMPIPPPVNPVYHIQEEGDLDEKITLADQPLTNINSNITNFVITVGNKKGQKEKNGTGEGSNNGKPVSRKAKQLSPQQAKFQKAMVRIVFLLAGIAMVLLMFVVYYFLNFG